MVYGLSEATLSKVKAAAESGNRPAQEVMIVYYRMWYADPRNGSKKALRRLLKRRMQKLSPELH